MTRYREEVYESKAYKAAVRKVRPSCDLEGNSGARRAEYFKKPLKVREAIRKAQKAQGRLDGF